MREERSSVHVVAKDWFVPLSCKGKSLSEAYNELNQFGLEQDEVPWVIQMVENPKWDLPGVDIFHGATSLMTHDYIHILLGRGVLPRDEAFVIGFTMGSTNRVTATEEKLYTFFAKYLYPKSYQFDDDDIHVYKDAVRLGYISDCKPLADVDYNKYLNWKIGDIRAEIGLESRLLRAYYEVEHRRCPENCASQRLLA
ncbi:MAG: hypothetical protein VYD34_06900 [Verrucomicrobiota bacterium]|nr:hypothetical protein [Verrucomicrobiota bacterium]